MRAAAPGALRFLAVLFLMMSVGLWAQTVSVAQISGTVKDRTGAIVPGAEVTVTQTDTGITRTVSTDENGFYTIPTLPVGPYRLEVSKSGFTTYVRTGITLQVNSNPTINAQLEVGAVSEQVVVEADVPLVETRSTGVGQVIDNRRVLELPLNGRQATELILLSGGSTPSPPAAFQSPRNYPTITVSVAGGSAAGVFFVMDGGDHNDPHNNLNLPIPFPDALGEFKVETSAVPARYGSHSSGVVNLITKSGTNNFHGSAFEFVRNGIFNARNAFALARDTLKRNQFGGTIGGPIRQNKLLFFGGYQGTITRSDPSTTINFVPSRAMLNGDFSQAASAACNAGRVVPLREPFAGTTVDPRLFSAVALKYAQYLPASNDPCGRFQYGVPRPSSDRQILGKIDYLQSTKHSIFGRYFFARYAVPYFYDGKNALTTSVGAQTNIAHSFVLGDTYSFGPALINSFRATVNRTENERTPVPFFSPTDFGVQMTPHTSKYSAISVSGSFGIGGGTANLGFWNSTLIQFADDVDYIKGSHQFSFGMSLAQSVMNDQGNQFSNGQFTFNGQNTGLVLADFLLGLPSDYTQGRPQLESVRMYHVGLYAQDSWKATPRLTLSYGLRWEPWLPMIERHDHVSHFDLGRFLQGQKSQVYVNAPAGLMFPGDNGYPGRSTSLRRLAQFAPRVGFVFDPDAQGARVIRGGYGIFYDFPTMFQNTRLSAAPPWGNSTTIINPQFANPWQGFAGGDPFQRPLSKDSPFPPNGVYVNYDLNTRPTYIQHWNLSFQQQFKADWAVTVSYVGNKMTHVWLNKETNPALYIPGSSTTTNTNQRRKLFLLNPAQGAFYANMTAIDDGGNGSYNGAIVSLQKRFSKNFSLSPNYTWSHCINEGEYFEAVGVFLDHQDPDNRRANRGNCASDRRHSFNISAVLATPSFQSAALRRVASGWQLSTIVKAMSGDSFTVASGRDNALTGTSNQRPNVVGDPNPSVRTLNRWFNPAAFQPNGPGQYGNAGRGFLRGPGRYNIDAALIRRFSIKEKHNFEVRAEAFNILNHLEPDDPAVYGSNSGPTATFTSPTFGSIISAADPRILQFALKYTF